MVTKTPIKARLLGGGVATGFGARGDLSRQDEMALCT